MDLTGWIQWLIHLSEISHWVVKDIRDYIKVWEEVEAKIINFEPKKKRIGLSLKALQDTPVWVDKKIVVTTASEEDKIDAEISKKKPKLKTKKTTTKK
jgi:predicted RNA-binding protein with RPS1 domain